MMTKQDCVALAETVRLMYLKEVERAYLVDELAAFCAARNPRFDRDRWERYIRGECGPNGGKVRRG